LSLSQLKTNCRFFRGDVPCRPHKESGVHCFDEKGDVCEFFDEVKENILIIKLGAIGDVIRTTPLFARLKKEHPQAKFYWLTNTPVVVPKEVDSVLRYDFKSVEILRGIPFDVSINLDKDIDACSIHSQINSKEKLGFTLTNGIISPADEKAEHKFFTGIFDDLNKANKKNYLEEIFEIAGLNYEGEKYVLDTFDAFAESWEIDKSKKVVGLNAGCGGRWTSRLWPEAYWIELAKSLKAKDYEVVLLGGELEHEKNLRIAQAANAKYFGHFRLETFISLVNKCDLVVTAVTMAMHITLALNKKIILFNNIFNKNEFELFGLGEILEPSKECKCFFSPKCVNEEYRCMEHLEPSRVLTAIKSLLQ